MSWTDELNDYTLRKEENAYNNFPYNFSNFFSCLTRRDHPSLPIWLQHFFPLVGSKRGEATIIKVHTINNNIHAVHEHTHAYHSFMEKNKRKKKPWAHDGYNDDHVTTNPHSTHTRIKLLCGKKITCAICLVQNDRYSWALDAPAL